MVFTIAIDGPVGAGKSTVADEVAARLGILHLDTGAMYRAFAWYALKEGVDTADEAALQQLTQRAMPEVRYANGKQQTLIDGQDVTSLIRTPEISMAASNVSKFAAVRRAMVARQQQLAAQQSMLLDGRDIGTVVLPNATLKIYLTASAQVRARRRYDEMVARGEECVYEDVLSDVVRRDEQDTTREVDPLRPAEDAQIVDSSEMTQQQVVSDIVRRLHHKLGKRIAREEKFTPLYSVGYAAASLLFRTIFPVTVHHEERALMDAPYVLIANHLSMMDPLLVAWKCSRYHIRFLGKKELIKIKPLRWLFDKLCMIPVDRHNMDMGALRACLKVLKEGHALGVFPEGTRHKQGVMEEMESGIAMIALRSGARLLPAYISGKVGLFRRVHVYYGDPINVRDIAQNGVNKEACEQVLCRIRTAYGTLLSEHASLGARK